MKGAAKNKAVTSGRLTGGGVAARPARRRVPPKPGPAARPEPAYSLYSTDSDDQVTSLHKGLDRCAALLGGILQAEAAEASSGPPGLPRAVKAAKSRPCTSLGKKTMKKPRAQTGQRSCQSVQQRAPGGASPSTTCQPAVAAVPPKWPQPRTSTPPPSGWQPLPQAAPAAPPTHCQVEGGAGEEEEEVIPVRDANTQNSAAHAAVSHVSRTCASKMSGLQLEPGWAGAAGVLLGVTRGGGVAETGVDVKTAQHLLGELKALIAGQGSVAERLLSQLEQTVSSPLMSVGTLDIQPEPDLSSLHSQNTELRRRVRILHQQLKERDEAVGRQNTETLCNSEALKEELAAARARLQTLESDLAELRKVLRDTESRLREQEAANEAIKTDLAATRSRLLDSEREKSELASLGQRRLEEMRRLSRTLGSRGASVGPDGSALGALRVTLQQDPVEDPAERVAHYLLSLGQQEPACAAERDRSQNLAPGDRWDAESARSGWSGASGSAPGAGDEAAFRDGLAALDASIASLQRSIQLDLRR